MSIAAVLIMRNEARCIARCLTSLAPHVDRLFCLDTGSTDDTIAIARAHGATVEQMVWPDDFSRARNHALALADADWNLIVDADEWIAQGGEHIRAFCKGAPRLGRVCVLSDDDSAGMLQASATPQSRSWITRLLPRGVRFSGRVHEQAISDLPREKLDVQIGHDGYLAAHMVAKQGRNRELLLAELAAHPGDAYLQFQLGRDAEGADHHGEACRWYEQALAGAAPDVPWRHDLVVRYLHCLGQSGRRPEALIMAEAQMANFPTSPDLFFVIGNLCLDTAGHEPARALDHWLPLAVTAWQRCLEIGERPDLEGSVAGRGSHLAQHNLDVLLGGMQHLPG
ncbi:glycosyltransferase [Novosphingobium terrae]|uniref:glycosyltransferase n=1 Tax=Novosphingobium terrae TaxID=2726189 RepID=UPI00197E46D8|nr:glycosyltransferase family 2 protein [Novosphingobium terrae]